MLNPILTRRDVAERYNRCLPDEVRQYLKGHGLASTVIDRQLLGWNGTHVTIPVFGDDMREVVGFVYATLPTDPAAGPEMVVTEVPEPQLYGRETLARKPHRVVICEGVFDRLILESRGFPAVTSTAGADAFPPQWKEAFDSIGDVFICFRRRSSSESAATSVQRLLPSARIATLPAEVGASGGIAEFFLHLLRTPRQFEVVLAGAGDNRPSPPRTVRSRSADASQERRAAQLRNRVRLHDVVFAYTNLQASGGCLVGHCPLHDDASRAFSVYPETDTYSCSVCGAAGDVVMFLMNKESMTFGQALEALECFQVTGTLR